MQVFIQLWFNGIYNFWMIMAYIIYAQPSDHIYVFISLFVININAVSMFYFNQKWVWIGLRQSIEEFIFIIQFSFIY